MIRISTIPLLRPASQCLTKSRSFQNPQFHSCRRLRQVSSESNPDEPPQESSESSPDESPVTPNLHNPFSVFKDAYDLPKATDPAKFKQGGKVVVYGFLGKRREKGQNLSFYDLQLSTPGRDTLQIMSSWKAEGSPEHVAHQSLKSFPSYSPVRVIGTIHEHKPQQSENNKAPSSPSQYELRPLSAKCLNTFPKDIIVSKNAVWPPKSRHLQMRFDPLLHRRLQLRHSIVTKFRQGLRRQHFLEVETPILFKSTPEGAREFLVPTRKKGFAYALPQSPQQYKQLLMAGGIPRYFQLAKCFRDEDHRADRQPEFTQLDLEMAFANPSDVYDVVNPLVASAIWSLTTDANAMEISNSGGPKWEKSTVHHRAYHACMSKYGTDKPDFRIKPPMASIISRITKLVSPDFLTMITSLRDPIVDTCKFQFNGSRAEIAKFIKEILDALPNTPSKLGEDSTPGVLFFDSSKPLNGLSALGHQAAERIVLHYAQQDVRCKDGDVIIVHARPNELSFHGSSTELGRLRTYIYNAAVEKGFAPKDNSLNFVWVDEFPLFTPNDGEPGQGGSAGFSATHHPFTAPRSEKDFDMLRTNPLRAKGSSFDLVLNGVEIGGGSRRIHVAEVQEYIMRDVLKMTDEGVSQFSHLLEALRAGCPPHVGFALGLDRFIALLCGSPSVRDVIAFPKDNRGEDKLVGSPSRTTLAQQKTYNLFIES